MKEKLLLLSHKDEKTALLYNDQTKLKLWQIKTAVPFFRNNDIKIIIVCYPGIIMILFQLHTILGHNEFLLLRFKWMVKITVTNFLQFCFKD